MDKVMFTVKYLNDSFFYTQLTLVRFDKKNHIIQKYLNDSFFYTQLTLVRFDKKNHMIEFIQTIMDILYT